MTTVYIVTRIDTGERWARKSITAILEDKEIPVKCSQQHFSKLIRDGKGYPVKYSGCTIDKYEALSIVEVRKANLKED